MSRLTHDEVLEALTHLWVEAYADACARVAVLERYLAETASRDDAIHAAHQLAGSLGIFGLSQGSDLARAIEHALEAGVDAATQAGPVHDLRALLTAASPSR